MTGELCVVQGEKTKGVCDIFVFCTGRSELRGNWVEWRDLNCVTVF